MVKRAVNGYINSFKGLRMEVWWLALVTLINRGGTMVVPFLALYLTADLNFTLKDVGWIMTAFGLGSVVGSWLGGKLTDVIGYYTVMFGSLITTGIAFLLLQFVHTFWGFSVGVFVLMLLADMFRPASFVAINAYSKPENRTRSVTLIRLAINLGFSAGPAVGGLIISYIGYQGLFWVDGITSIAAGFLFIYLLEKKEHKREDKNTNAAPKKSPYKDGPFLVFTFCIFLIGFTFLQYFSTIPLYYRNVHHLSEDYIGLIMGFNGFLIFLIEMPIIKAIDTPRFSIFRILFISILLFAGSFAVLNLHSWIGILWIGMTLMTFGEMLNFPFLNKFALDRSEGKKSGEYMALFTMAFSLAHILGHNAGMQLIEAVGYNTTWNIMTGILLFAAIIMIYLRKVVQNERQAIIN